MYDVNKIKISFKIYHNFIETNKNWSLKEND